MAALDFGEILEQIESPRFGAPELTEKKDIFSKEERKAWHEVQTDAARCDFAPNRVRITPRSGVWFLTVWKKSIKGRLLTDIKADDKMPEFFAKEVANLIKAVIGEFTDKSGYCIVTTPPRRHKERNFAVRTAKIIAGILGIRFYDDCAVARSRQRVGAIFDPGNIPMEQNIIVFDDIVTTGQTMAAMKNMLVARGKNCVFFAGINNKL